MKLKKYLCRVFTIKDVLDLGFRTSAYFHKDSVTSCNKKEIIIKKIVIMEKNFDN